MLFKIQKRTRSTKVEGHDIMLCVNKIFNIEISTVHEKELSFFLNLTFIRLIYLLDIRQKPPAFFFFLLQLYQAIGSIVLKNKEQ